MRCLERGVVSRDVFCEKKVGSLHLITEKASVFQKSY